MDIKLNIKTGKISYIFLNIILILLIINLNDIYAERLNDYDIDITDNSNTEKLIAGDFPDIAISLEYIERAFKETDHNYLELVSLEIVKKTKEYKLFNKYIRNLYNITLNYRQEEAQKKFKINNNNNHMLVINFEKSLNNNGWTITDAQEVINDSISPIKKHLFSAGAYTRGFNDILQLIKNKKITTFLGLAPSGVINIEYLNKNKLHPSRDINSTIKNVIIFNDEKIIDIYYFKFKLFPIGFKDKDTFKSGWLLTEIGKMESLYEKGKDLFIDYILGKIKYSKEQLRQKSNITYIPLGIEKTENEAAILTENRVERIHCCNHINEKYIRISLQFIEEAIALDDKINSIGNIINIEGVFLIENISQNLEKRECPLMFEFINNKISILVNKNFYEIRTDFVEDKNTSYIDLLY